MVRAIVHLRQNFQRDKQFLPIFQAYGDRLLSHRLREAGIASIMPRWPFLSVTIFVSDWFIRCSFLSGPAHAGTGDCTPENSRFALPPKPLMLPYKAAFADLKTALQACRHAAPI